jgi:hypothetical protein
MEEMIKGVRTITIHDDSRTILDFADFAEAARHFDNLYANAVEDDYAEEVLFPILLAAQNEEYDYIDEEGYAVIEQDATGIFEEVEEPIEGEPLEEIFGIGKKKAKYIFAIGIPDRTSTKYNRRINYRLLRDAVKDAIHTITYDADAYSIAEWRRLSRRYPDGGSVGDQPYTNAQLASLIEVTCTEKQLADIKAKVREIDPRDIAINDHRSTTAAHGEFDPRRLISDVAILNALYWPTASGEGKWATTVEESFEADTWFEQEW